MRHALLLILAIILTVIGTFDYVITHQAVREENGIYIAEILGQKYQYK